MEVPKALYSLVEKFEENDIDYRIGGGQAAVFYGLREDAEDWDLAIEEVTPELKTVMKEEGFTEIPDSNGLSWEGPTLIDFIIAEGDQYPTLDELGVHYVNGLKFVARSMMGYINWKEGESAYQHLKDYRERIESKDLPEAVKERTDLEWFQKISSIDTFKPNVEASSQGEQMSTIANKLVDMRRRLRFARNRPDVLPGGYGDELDYDDVDLEELIRGIEVEMEHIGDSTEFEEDEEALIATDIAMDHLAELDDYYTRLDKMESKAVATLVSRVTKIASKLEDEGCPLEACLLDRLIREGGLVVGYEQESVDYTNLANRYRKKALMNAILEKATGVSADTVEYYRKLEPVLTSFAELLDKASELDKGSEKYIEIIRYVQEAFNSKYDPYNTDHVPTKIRYILELLKISKIIEHNLDKVATPELGRDTIVETFVDKLKEQKILQEFNKLKKALD